MKKVDHWVSEPCPHHSKPKISVILTDPILSPHQNFHSMSSIINSFELKKKITVIHFTDEDDENVQANISNKNINILFQPQSNIINGDIPSYSRKIIYLDDLSARELTKKRKKSVTFERMPTKTTQLKAMKANLQKCSQESEIMKFIILKKKPFLNKMYFFLKKFIISHLLSTFVSIFFIIIQNKYAKYCYMPPNCLCQDDLIVKTYTAIKDYFCYYIIYIIAILQSIIIRDLFMEKTLLIKLIFFILSTFISIFWLIFNKEANYHGIYIYIFYLFMCLLFEVGACFKKSMHLKETLIFCTKINQVALVLFFNYLFYILFYSRINDSILDNLSYTFSKNMINLYLSVYTLLISYFLKRFIIQYSQYMVKMNKRNTNAIINVMRFSLCIFMSIPASNLLKMDIYDWGGWLLLVSYGNFLLGFYFKIDLIGFFYLKLRKLFTKCCKESTQQIDEKNKIYFEKLFSGCVLDIQLVCCFRLIILYLSKRWSGAHFHGNYYKDCSFEIEPENFQMSLWGLLALIMINLGLAVFIFFYMIRKKNLLILYKIKHNYLYNVYFLYLTHIYFEGNLNMFYFYLPQKQL